MIGISAQLKRHFTDTCGHCMSCKYHVLFTLGCHEHEWFRLLWAESAVRVGCYHKSVLSLRLESRYPSSSASLSGDNDAFICPRDLIGVYSSRHHWQMEVTRRD